MQYIAIKDLQSHPRNIEFFDDITGDKWEDFKKSIVRRGVVEGVVITQDLVVVSGHQRVRACRELGILEVPCRITHYPDNDPQTGNPKEDMILEDLISTNILQRGVGNVNPMKMARCIVELERIYGIFHGNNQRTTDNLNSKTQKELANQIQVSQQQLQDYKKLTNLIPEFQELVEEGQLKATTAYKVWAKMSKEEQEKFFNDIGREQIAKMTQKQTDEFVKLEQENERLKNLAPEVIEIIKEVDKTDYETINKLEKQVGELNSHKNDNENNRKQIEQLNNALRQTNHEKITIEKQLNDLNSTDNKEKRRIEELKLKEEQLKHQAHISIFDLQIKIHNFINEASPSVFLQGAVASSGSIIKDDLLDSVIALEEFSKALREMLHAQIQPNQDNIIEIN